MRVSLIMLVFFLISHSAYAKGLAQEDIEGGFHKALILERVIDGDTIIASGQKIRLWGIDAPEKNEPLFLASKMFLETMLKDQSLRCKFIEEDRYKRDVMHCLIGSSDIGSMMVYMGMARDFSKYSGDYYQYEEDLAKKEKRGIWKKEQSEPGPVACTMEAKQCPDGSYVSRTGPNCEFAQCSSQ